MKSRTLVIGIILACGGLFVVVIAACGGFLFVTFKNMDSAVSPKIDALFAAIDNGTFGDKYATETTPELRRTVTKEQWEQLGAAIKVRLGRFKTKNRVQFSVRQFNAEQYADVSYSATFEKGAGDVQARLARIGGEWRFVTIHVDSPEFLKVPSNATCPHCGKAYTAPAKFCPECGKPVTDPNGSSPLRQGDAPQGNESPSKAAPTTMPAR